MKAALAITTVLSLFCAPAPLPRKGKDLPPFPIGTWSSPTNQIISTFRKDGSYEEHWHGVRYDGRWRLVGKGTVEVCWGGDARTSYTLTFERLGTDRVRMVQYLVELRWW